MPLDSGILTDLLNSFVGEFSGGYSRIHPDAMHLLSILATLEVAIAALWWCVSDGETAVELIKKVMKIGFFIFVVANYQTLIACVLDGFVFVGLKAGGRSLASAADLALLKDPSAIVRQGLKIAEPIFVHTANYDVFTAAKNLADLLVTNLAALLIILAFFALAIQVFITYLEFYLMAVLGLILIPFGAFKYTAFLAEKVFGAIITFGVRLMVLAFILATVQPTLDRLTPQPDPSLPQVLLLLLTALTIAGLSWHAPAVASGLVSGAPSLSVGTVAGTGLALGVGAVGAGIAATAAAKTGVAATKAAVGVAQGAVHRVGELASRVRRASSGDTSAGSPVAGGGGDTGGGGGGSGGGANAAGGDSSASGGGANGGGGDAGVAGMNAGNGAGDTPVGSSSSKDNSGKDKTDTKTSEQTQQRDGPIPGWAYQLSLAQRILPQETHPGSGQHVPLGRD